MLNKSIISKAISSFRSNNCVTLSNLNVSCQVSLKRGRSEGKAAEYAGNQLPGSVVPIFNNKPLSHSSVLLTTERLKGKVFTNVTFMRNVSHNSPCNRFWSSSNDSLWMNEWMNEWMSFHFCITSMKNKSEHNLQDSYSETFILCSFVEPIIMYISLPLQSWCIILLQTTKFSESKSFVNIKTLQCVKNQNISLRLHKM
jgi:hypothetical protein